MALNRLGIRWRRAKHWITSPDPGYVRKKEGPRPLDPAGPGSPRLGPGIPGRDLVVAAGVAGGGRPGGREGARSGPHPKALARAGRLRDDTRGEVRGLV